MERKNSKMFRAVVLDLLHVQCSVTCQHFVFLAIMKERETHPPLQYWGSLAREHENTWSSNFKSSLPCSISVNRARRRLAREQSGKMTDHLEGLSSDDEETSTDTTNFNMERGEIILMLI